MDEQVSTTVETAAEPQSSTPLPKPEALDLLELQQLAPAELEEFCRKYDVRMHAGRSRHHHILD
ncbi:MAG TPA: hypothetical protein VK993_07050, partial [Chthoniobacterales bacterium]|nr:hypothetical protein [Chthoniobacterales bacterium]